MPDDYDISAAELQWAFDEFDRLNLRDVVYSDRHSVISVMGRYTNEDPRISAGCETGIKLGLLIAAKRAVTGPIQSGPIQSRLQKAEAALKGYEEELGKGWIESNSDYHQQLRDEVDAAEKEEPKDA